MFHFSSKKRNTRVSSYFIFVFCSYGLDAHGELRAIGLGRKRTAPVECAKAVSDFLSKQPQ